MKKFLAIVSIICFFTACGYKKGSGVTVTQNRNTDNFTGVSVGGNFDVEIKTGSDTKVRIEADDNVIDDIETRVENNQLKISMKNGMSYNNVHMKVFITAPKINKISSSASADVNVIDALASDEKIIINASSGSSVKAAVNAPGTEADASSGAEIDLTGRTQKFDVEVSSGASVDAYELLSENTKVQTSSGATAQVHASIQLDASASSGGSVSYRGAAALIKKQSSGGTVEKKN